MIDYRLITGIENVQDSVKCVIACLSHVTSSSTFGLERLERVRPPCWVSNNNETKRTTVMMMKIMLYSPFSNSSEYAALHNSYVQNKNHNKKI